MPKFTGRLCFAGAIALVLASPVSSIEAAGEAAGKPSRASFDQAAEMFKDICLDTLPEFRHSKEIAVGKYGAEFDGRKDLSWHSFDPSSFVKTITISRRKECSITVETDGRGEHHVEAFRAILPDLPSTGLYSERTGKGDDLDHLAQWQYLFSANEATPYRLLKKYSYRNTKLGDAVSLTLSVSYRSFQCTVSKEQLELFGITGEPPRKDLLLSDAERWC